jgi:deoxyadenosine/deoxycytidine kinase
MNTGKIICVVGAPRTGKSFLVSKLAEHYSAKAFFEGEDSDFPKRIKDDISENIRPLERIIWFRNRLVKNYMQSLAIKKEGGVVISDVPYFAVDLYVDVLTEDLFERDILHTISDLDMEMLGMPDKIVYLTSSEERTKEFIELGGREFDTGENYYQNQIVPLQKAWKDYLSTLENQQDILSINRHEIDFNNEKDFQKLIQMIEI